MTSQEKTESDQVMRQRIRSHLETGLRLAASSPSLELPAYTLFVFSSLLIDALAHPDNNMGTEFIFLDMALECEDSPPLLFSSKADCDLELICNQSDDIPFPVLAERIRNKQLPHASYRTLFVTEDLSSVRISLFIGFDVGHDFLEIICKELNAVWQQFDQIYLARGGYQHWQMDIGSHQSDWPASIRVNSVFAASGAAVIDQLRAMLDHLRMDLEQKPIGSSNKPSLFFLRKTRYYSEGKHHNSSLDGIRSQVNRRISERVHADFLLGYFLSWGEARQLINAYENDLQGLTKALVAAKECCNDNSECKNIDQLLTILLSTDTHTQKVRNLVEAVEQPLGDIPDEPHKNRARSVTDSSVISTIPEVVWNLDSDPRYRDEFLQAAPAQLDAIEQWRWQDSSHNQSDKSLLFIPFPIGGQTIFSAYMMIPSHNPLHNDASMQQFIELSMRLIQAQRTTLHQTIELYPQMIMTAFVDRYVDYRAKCETDEGKSNHDALVASLIKGLNDACRAIALTLNLPAFEFSFVEKPEGDWFSLWKCFEKAQLVPDVKGRFPNRSNLWKWDATEINAAKLHHIALRQVERGKKVGHDLFVVLTRMLGRCIQYELPLHILSLREAGKGYRENYAHSVRHETGNLLRFISDHADESAVRQAAGFAYIRLGHYADDGASNIGDSVVGHAPIRDLMAFFTTVTPIPSSLNQVGLKVIRCMDASISQDQELPLSPEALFAIYENFINNAIDMLRIVTLNQPADIKGRTRYNERSRLFIEQYGSYEARINAMKVVPESLIMIQCFRREGGSIILDIIDNAPTFLLKKQKIDYADPDGVGRSGIRNIENELDNNGHECVFNKTRRIDKDEITAISSLLGTKSSPKDLCGWTITSFGWSVY